jgi:hypothetical protein
MIGRRVDPTTSRFRRMNNLAERPPVDDAPVVLRIRQTMRRDLRGPLVRQPEEA